MEPVEDGRWTMIYDEGFEVNVEGLSLFAFSRFDLHSSGEVRFNVSRCGAGLSCRAYCNNKPGQLVWLVGASSSSSC
eukprot:5281862-Amphidinium_carterae.2